MANTEQALGENSSYTQIYSDNDCSESRPQTLANGWRSNEKKLYFWQCETESGSQPKKDISLKMIKKFLGNEFLFFEGYKEAQMIFFSVNIVNGGRNSMLPPWQIYFHDP